MVSDSWQIKLNVLSLCITCHQNWLHCRPRPSPRPALHITLGLMSMLFYQGSYVVHTFVFGKMKSSDPQHRSRWLLQFSACALSLTRFQIAKSITFIIGACKGSWWQLKFQSISDLQSCTIVCWMLADVCSKKYETTSSQFSSNSMRPGMMLFVAVVVVA